MYRKKLFTILVLTLSMLAGWTVGVKAQEELPEPRVYIPVAVKSSVFTPPPPPIVTVMGQLRSEYTNEPMKNFPLRLAEIYCAMTSPGNEECAILLDVAFSPGAYTDDQGYFTMTFEYNPDLTAYRPLYGYLDIFFFYYELADFRVYVEPNETYDLGVLYTTLNEDPWAEGGLDIWTDKGDAIHVK